jgi:hypothetical protein
MDVLDEELKEFQQRLEAIHKEFLEQGSIEVFGYLKIVVTSFDRIDRIAFQEEMCPSGPRASPSS